MAAEKDNKYAVKWELEQAKEIFLQALEYAETNDDCLSLGDAIYQSEIPYSTYDYLAEKHDVLGQIKNDTKRAVIRKINKGSIQGDYNPASCIWRMKQLGEKDQQYQDITTKGKEKITVNIID